MRTLGEQLRTTFGRKLRELETTNSLIGFKLPRRVSEAEIARATAHAGLGWGYAVTGVIEVSEAKHGTGIYIKRPMIGKPKVHIAYVSEEHVERALRRANRIIDGLPKEPRGSDESDIQIPAEERRKVIDFFAKLLEEKPGIFAALKRKR